MGRDREAHEEPHSPAEWAPLVMGAMLCRGTLMSMTWGMGNPNPQEPRWERDARTSPGSIPSLSVLLSLLLLFLNYFSPLQLWVI